MQPIESHNHLEDEWFVNKPSELRRLLGREYFVGRSPTLKHDDSFALKEKRFRMFIDLKRYEIRRAENSKTLKHACKSAS